MPIMARKFVNSEIGYGMVRAARTMMKVAEITAPAHLRPYLPRLIPRRLYLRRIHAPRPPYRIRTPPPPYLPPTQPRAPAPPPAYRLPILRPRCLTPTRPPAPTRQ